MFKVLLVPAAVASATIYQKHDCCGSQSRDCCYSIAGKIPNRLVFLLLLYIKD
jgi:hypothetical protein